MFFICLFDSIAGLFCSPLPHLMTTEEKKKKPTNNNDNTIQNPKPAAVERRRKKKWAATKFQCACAYRKIFESFIFYFFFWNENEKAQTLTKDLKNNITKPIKH